MQSVFGLPKLHFTLIPIQDVLIPVLLKHMYHLSAAVAS